MENELSSEEILPEAPPASSLMVQEVLDELEGSEATPPGISSEEALQANLESEEAAEKVSLPSSSVSSALFESEELVYDAGLFDAHGFPSFEFHSISLGNQPSPGDAYTETSRASPLMVQEFFEDLEGEAETGSVVGPANPLDASPAQSLKPSTLGLSVKRPAPDDGEDDDEVAGPSSKIAKADTTPSPPCSVSSSETKESFPSFAVDSTEPGDFGSSVASSSFESEEFVDFLNFPIPELEPSDAPLVPPSVSTDASRSSAAAGPGPPSAPSGYDTTPSPPWSVSSSETKESFPSFAVDSTEPGDFVSSVASSSFESEEILDFLNSLIPESEPSHAPSVPSAVSADASPSSAVVGPGSSSAPSGGDTAVHPWLRVPDFTPGVGDMEFRPECLSWSVRYQVHGPLMAKIREVLVQPKLDYAQARGLVVYSEYLANHAFHEQRGPVSSRRPTDAAELLGRRFMIFFLLHSASKALRQPWPQQQWWRDLASVIPSTSPFTPGGKGLNRGSKASVALAVELSAAIELYKSGSAPDDDQLVDIMRKLFCSPASPHHFKSELWDPWRQDDDSSSSSS
ncbi:hypothetical protein Emed_003743 [Eimeria media]